MKKISFILVFLIISPIPAVSQVNEYDVFYNYFKKEGFIYITQFCSFGRRFNQQNISYWEPKVQRNLETSVLKTLKKSTIPGDTQRRLNSWMSAVATHMKKNCPDVW